MFFRMPLLLAICCAGPCATAMANCSRPIVVPASSLGKIMMVDGARGQAWGIYPDLLRAYGVRAGCSFVFPVVPRARAEVLVQTGEADLLLSAVKVSHRDSWGNFVPMLGSEWVLVSHGNSAPPRSVQALLDLPRLKFNAVRGFNGGPSYLNLLAGLEARGELEYVNDAQTIIRKMAAGRVDYTVMASQTFAGTLDDMPPAQRIAVRYSRLDGLAPAVTGVYLSKAMPAADAAEVTALLQQIRAADGVLAGLRHYFTPDEMISSFLLLAPPAGPPAAPSQAAAQAAPVP